MSVQKPIPPNEAGLRLGALSSQGRSYLNESGWLIILLILGLLPRLLFVHAFPTQPISDFRSIIDFGLQLENDLLSPGTRFWHLFSPGLPLILSVMFRVSSLPPEAMARVATAVTTGLLPLVPFAVWRGALSLRVRVLAGVLLALWPGQILFSGVVAQDNWVILPVVALAALSIRSMLPDTRPCPICAAVAYGLAVMIREEMLIALAPLVIAAAVGTNTRHMRTSLLLAIPIAGALVAGPVLHRGLATGRFALTTTHSAESTLGAYVPDAGVNYWANPKPFIAATEADLLYEEDSAITRGMMRIAWQEVLRRPDFHAMRIMAATLNGLISTGTGNIYWALTGPGVLGQAYDSRAEDFVASTAPILRNYPLIVHGLFGATIVFGLLLSTRTRWIILPPLGSIALKTLLHAFTVSQPRYFMVVVAMELLVISVMLFEMIRSHESILLSISLVVGLLGGIGLPLVQDHAQAYILAHTEQIQRAYVFPLSTTGGDLDVDCRMEQGRLTTIWQNGATIELLRADPNPGDEASVSCEMREGYSAQDLTIRIQDSYPHGGLSGRIMQRIYVGTEEVFTYDIGGDAWIGWHVIRVSAKELEEAGTMTIEILAANPDAGAKWGPASSTMFTIEADDGP
jgi:hypothetical protein